jgi:hypothetical protein
VTAQRCDHHRHAATAQAQFSPEGASGAGLTEYDGRRPTSAPTSTPAIAAAMRSSAPAARACCAAQTPAVRQDMRDPDRLGRRRHRRHRLGEKSPLPWIDVPRMEFGNVQTLLDPQLPPRAAAKALELLQRYTGLSPAARR